MNMATQPASRGDDETIELTFCVLVLRNGFTVTGESACASPGTSTPRSAARSRGRTRLRRSGRSKATRSSSACATPRNARHEPTHHQGALHG